MMKDGDIFGDGVNIAARLEGLADPGGICISRGIHDHVMKKLPFEFDDLGEQSVKNIAQPVRVYRLLPAGRRSELRSTPIVTPSPDIAADIPSLSEGEPAMPAADPRAVEIEFWDSIKNSILASEYEAYLGQYPEGAFVALAQVRLEAIRQDSVAMRDPHEREIELSFWESVRASDNPALVQAYLEKYPNGEFCALARIRVDELKRDSRTA
jgi:hypothetical protein